MKQLNITEQQSVTGGVDVSNLFAAGVSGAIGRGSFGAGLGTLVGAGVMSVPAAAVLGLTGAGIGFISGLTIYAFSTN